VQLRESFPEVVNIAIGPSHVSVEPEHDPYFISADEVKFAREGNRASVPRSKSTRHRLDGR